MKSDGILIVNPESVVLSWQVRWKTTPGVGFWLVRIPVCPFCSAAVLASFRTSAEPV